MMSDTKEIPDIDPLVDQAKGLCETIYGPVKSRRHGVSLGINLGSSTKKICTWGCLYCQCGFGERREILEADPDVPTRSEVISKLRARLAQDLKLDSITFAGNSEPADHPEFPEIVRDVMKLKVAMRAKFIVNCLSNGSELYREEVVRACNQLDEAWIKLDCGTDDLFKRLNRPVAKVGPILDHVERLKKLKNLRIQTLLWKTEDSVLSNKNIANYTLENLEALEKIFCDLNPKMIHLTTVSREPAFLKLKPCTLDELKSFADQLIKQGIPVQVYP